MCYKLKIHAFNTHQQSYFYPAAPCSPLFIRFCSTCTPILLSSGKPLVFIHILASNSFILSSPSQPTVVFSKGTGSKLHLVHVPAICVYKPCLSFVLGFSLALPSSSSEPFFSLFCTFNTRHGHIAPRAIKVTTVWDFPCSLRKRLGTQKSYDGPMDY